MRTSVLALLAIGLCSGCTGTCRKSTPYVPFLEDAATTAAKDGEVAAQDAAPEAGAKPAFVPQRASIAPPGSTKLSLDGLDFEAPPGAVIVAALAWDLDGDGQKDVAAYVQPPGGGGGELRFHRGDGKGGLLPSRPVTGPTSSSDLTLPAPCLAKPMPSLLSLVGPHTVALDVRPTCGDAAPSSRRFVVAAFAPTPSIRWSARVAEPPTGFSFVIDVEATDRDGDGVDDPSFTLALEGGGPPFDPGDRIQVKLPYWDRAAGVARDRQQPEASLQALSQGAHARAAKKGSQTQVAPLVRRLRLLHAAICAEAGAPWLEIGGERGVACGASKALEEAGNAEVKAAIGLGDALAAIAARERLAASSVARTGKTRSEIDKAIEAAFPMPWGTSKDAKVVASTPSKGAPSWGALAFEKSGSLLVRTATGVVRIDPTTFDEAEAGDVTAWPWEVTLPGKDARLAAVVDACDAPHLAARVAGHDVPTGSILLPLPPIPPLSPNRCGGGASFQAVPVAWSDSGLYTLVAREPVFVPSSITSASGARATGTWPAPAARVPGAWVPGSPRSPNGAFLVVPTRFGLVRRDESSSATVVVRTKELEGLYATLRECTVSDSGQKLACVRDNGKVVIVDASPPAPSGDE